MRSELGTFTPISHSLTHEVGLVCAAVYGVVWRYCQMKDGECTASLGMLGDEINVDRATVMRAIKKLCELGYLIDLSPDRHKAHHTYKLGTSVAERNSSVAERNSSVAERNSSEKSVAESHTKIDKEERLLRDNALPIGRAAKTPPKLKKPTVIPAISIFVEVTGKHCLTNPQMAEVKEVVGDTPMALENWRSVVKAWIMRGFKPTNAAGMLEWFKNGIPVYQQNGINRNGRKQQNEPQPSQATGLGEWTDEQKAELRAAGIPITDDS